VLELLLILLVFYNKGGNSNKFFLYFDTFLQAKRETEFVQKKYVKKVRNSLQKEQFLDFSVLCLVSYFEEIQIFEDFDIFSKTKVAIVAVFDRFFIRSLEYKKVS
jgi:hypothetical protein